MRICTLARNTLPVLLIAALFAAGCGEEPDLPSSVQTGIDDFGANDTSFVRVNPDWSSATGYDWQSPGDILAAYDGFLYVVDELDGGRVVQTKRGGQVTRPDLFREAIERDGQPLGVGMDTKLNLFMVNGSDRIHVWNHAVEKIGVAEVVQSFTLVDDSTGQEYPINNEAPFWQQFLDYGISETAFEMRVEEMVTTTEPDSLQEMSREYLFYQDTRVDSLEEIDRPASFTAVDGGARYGGYIVAADEANDYFINVAVLPTRMLILRDGATAYRYEGVYTGDVIGPGQGQVSTNEPAAVVSTGSLNNRKLYFTQLAGNFRVQRLKLSGGNWNFDFQPTASGEPDVIQLGYFQSPTDIAVAESDERGLGLFYVADSSQNRVAAFYPSGFRFREVAAEEELVDLAAGQVLANALDDPARQENRRQLDPALNPGLVDHVAAEEEQLRLETGESLGAALEGEGLGWFPELNEDLSLDWTAPSDTTITVMVGVEETVEVLWPMLNSPRGVATWDGVVYICDTGNDRIVRFKRSDSDSYIPNNPDLP